MKLGPEQQGRARRRVIIAEIIGACLLILVLAQALTAVLSQAAFRRLATTTTAERVELLARDTASKIDTGLRLGKPLAQYFGLERQLQQSLASLPDLAGAAVLMPDGVVLAMVGQGLAIAPGLVDAVVQPQLTPPRDSGIGRLASGAVLLSDQGRVLVAVPLQGRTQSADGALVLAVDNSIQVQRESAFLRHSLLVLGLTTGAAALFLLIVLGWLLPFEALTRPGGRARLLLPLTALMLAQAVYAVETVSSFRTAWLDSTRANVMLLAERMQSDLNKVLDMGIDIRRLNGVDQVLARLEQSLPAISSVSLLDAASQVLATADTVRSQDAPAGIGRAAVVPEELHMFLPLTVAGRGQVGALEIRLDPDVLAAGVRARVLDAGTVALVSAVAVFEMYLLLTLLIDSTLRKSASMAGLGAEVGSRGEGAQALRSTSAEDVARLARPFMFGFLFSWALPLSFLPLYAATLPAGWLSLPPGILMALPLSAEMLCGLGGALLAGRLTDRSGWRVPVLGGLLLVAVSSLLSAGAASLEAFVLARSGVGAGYGLAWMGLQGLVVAGSSPRFRGRNMAWLFAGLFAGHLSGSAVGAMLADQAGYRPVFVASAVLVALPLLGMLLARRRMAALSRPAAALALGPDDAASKVPQAPRGAVQAVGLRNLLFSRDFGALLAGSVVPFSIAQVGLLYFALPLYLQAQGVSASGTGRVLMLYGLCMIYLGPLVGRLVDGSRNKKPFIVLGGLLGGAGMAYLYIDSSLFAVTLAVFLLALGSCWSGAAQTAWMLGLGRVQQYGPGGATSVLRAADKFGQMLGPLFVGALFTVVGLAPGLAITGVFYIVATLVFVTLAPPDAKRPG